MQGKSIPSNPSSIQVAPVAVCVTSDRVSMQVVQLMCVKFGGMTVIFLGILGTCSLIWLFFFSFQVEQDVLLRSVYLASCMQVLLCLVTRSFEL